MSLNGIIFVNKKAGISSAGVVREIKRLVKSKVGHGGTLDPIATGVLPILIGEGTKFGSMSLQKNKTYNAEKDTDITSSSNKLPISTTESESITKTLFLDSGPDEVRTKVFLS